MADQDAKKTFYNVVTNPDVESQKQVFDLESIGETRQNLPFCADSGGSRWTPNNNTKESTNAAP